MQINISLPETADLEGADAVRHFLRQLELSVHHAQKALKEMEAMNAEIDGPETFYATYRVYGFEASDEDGYKGVPAKLEIELYTM